jgi:phosphomannomutase
MDNLNLTMFKQYDIRTRYNVLTHMQKERLYNAVALYIRDSVKATSVVIGRDARLNVPELAEGLAAMLRKAGLDVLINPLPISTCQFYYTCMQHRTSAGIMVTASHNPAEYVGLKLVGPGVEPIAFGCGPEDGIRKIKELYEADARVTGDKHGRLTVINHLYDYIDYCMKLSGVTEGSLKGTKILLEFLNGAAGTEMALAFQKAGADIECRNVAPDGLFRQGDPNPIIEPSIAPARAAMREGNFDFGFCFDGDGDRVDLMAPNGEQIVPGLNMSIIVRKMLQIYRGGNTDVYADVKAIPIALCEIAKSGVNVHIIRNGHSFIKEKLRENCAKGYFAAEEESAHYYMNYPYDPDDYSKGCAAIESTLFIALLSAKCYKEDPAAYERAYRLQTSLSRAREWPLHCEAAPEKMQDIMDEVESRMRELGATVIKEMDDGSDLDACLMRFNLPEKFGAGFSLEDRKWIQVAQRISRSEEAMCRWEVVSNDPEECVRYNNYVREITDRYVIAGYAHY